MKTGSTEACRDFQNSTIGEEFNQSMLGVHLPMNLQSFRLGESWLEFAGREPPGQSSDLDFGSISFGRITVDEFQWQSCLDYF